VNWRKTSNFKKNDVYQGLGHVLSKILDGCLFMAKRSVKIAITKTVLFTKSINFFKKKRVW